MERGGFRRGTKRTTTKRPDVARIARHHTHTADDDVARGPRVSRRRTAWAHVILDDQVRVVAPEPEVTDRRTFDRPVPWRRRGRQGKGRLLQRRRRLVAQC